MLGATLWLVCFRESVHQIPQADGRELGGNDDGWRSRTASTAKSG